jgi:hypothetical protein
MMVCDDVDSCWKEISKQTSDRTSRLSLVTAAQHRPSRNPSVPPGVFDGRHGFRVLGWSPLVGCFPPWRLYVTSGDPTGEGCRELLRIPHQTRMLALEVVRLLSRRTLWLVAGAVDKLVQSLGRLVVRRRLLSFTFASCVRS